MILKIKSLAILLLLAGCGSLKTGGGYARVGVFPPHNEAIHAGTQRIRKWTSTLEQRFTLKTLDIGLEGKYDLMGSWPEDSFGYGWDVGVLGVNIHLQWPNNKPLSVWYHKQRDFLVINHTQVSDESVCNCTYGNSVGLEYVW